MWRFEGEEREREFASGTCAGMVYRMVDACVGEVR